MAATAPHRSSTNPLVLVMRDIGSEVRTAVAAASPRAGGRQLAQGAHDGARPTGGPAAAGTAQSSACASCTSALASRVKGTAIVCAHCPTRPRSQDVAKTLTAALREAETGSRTKPFDLRPPRPFVIANKPNPAARPCESVQIPATPRKRTMGLEPTTFGLGSQRTTACQSQMDGRCSQDVAKIARRVCAKSCEMIRHRPLLDALRH
jgi:hypothetical protein